MAVLTSCGGSVGNKAGTAIAMRYAKLLSMEQHDGYRLVSVSDPWKNGSVLHQYALIDSNGNASAVPEGVTAIRVPLQRLCISTSVHAGLMHKLGALDQVGSICEGKYILNPTIQAQIKSGHIKDVGSGLNPNVEMIAQLRTDALLMSPFEGASYGLLEKTGIPIIECADYMETSALGRAEWMKFYGMLVGRETEANKLFDEIEKNYNDFKTLVAKEETHPKLLADMLNGNTWYMPGGGSIYGTLYKDAGANFTIASDNVSGSQPLSLEKVLLEGKDADYWIIKYSRPQDFNYASILKENSVYGKFKAFRQKHIFGCNAFSVPFYEEAPFRPDLLLGDIISIIYPYLLPDRKMVFYAPLED